MLALLAGCAKVSRRTGETLPPTESPSVGLNILEQRKFREFYQGNPVIPTGMLYSMRMPDGRLLVEAMLDRGFVDMGRNALPMGLGRAHPRDSPRVIGHKVSFMSLNCAACHSAQFDYGGRRFLIDGAPGQVDVEGFAKDIEKAVKHTTQSKTELFRALRRYLAFVRRPVNRRWRWRFGLAAGELDLNLRAIDEIEKGETGEALIVKGGRFNPTVNEESEEAVQERQKVIIDELRGESSRGAKESLPPPDVSRLPHRGLLKIIRDFRIQVNNSGDVLRMIHRADRMKLTAGPGRDDAWGLIDRIMAGDSSAQFTAPISVPPLFGAGTHRLFHYDGNTNSIMERNIAQAVALGSIVRQRGDAVVDPRRVHQVNKLAEKITGPRWLSAFPKLDPELVTEGKALFEKKLFKARRVWDVNGRPLVAETVSCNDCHLAVGQETQIRFYDVGTSKFRLNHYLKRPQYLKRLRHRLSEVKRETAKRQDPPVLQAEIDEWEGGKVPEWRLSPGYLARPLDGVWATSPYLHNGSVRSLHQLLLPQRQREKSFQTGGRDFDPIEVGFRSSVLPLVKGSRQAFTLNTLKAENSRLGHDFGGSFTDRERRAVIEYMKTFSRGKRGL